MAKASRSRKNKSTRKVRKGSRKMRGGMKQSNVTTFTSKGRRAIVEESSKLRDEIDDAIESKNISQLQEFFEGTKSKYLSVLKKALKCLKKEEDIGKINDLVENISTDVSKHFDIVKKAFECLNKNKLLEE